MYQRIDSLYLRSKRRILIYYPGSSVADSLVLLLFVISIHTGLRLPKLDNHISNQYTLHENNFGFNNARPIGSPISSSPLKLKIGLFKFEQILIGILKNCPKLSSYYLSKYCNHTSISMNMFYCKCRRLFPKKTIQQ